MSFPSGARCSLPLGALAHPLSLLVPSTWEALTAIHHYLVSARKARRRITRPSDNRSFTVRISACVRYKFTWRPTMLTRPINVDLCHFMAKKKPRTLDFCMALSTTSLASRLLLGVLPWSNGGAYALLRAGTAQFSETETFSYLGVGDSSVD